MYDMIIMLNFVTASRVMRILLRVCCRCLSGLDAYFLHSSHHSSRVLSFVAFVHEHHEVEEKLYFPWLQTKVVIPAKEFAKGHEDLMAMLDEMDEICQKIVGKQGIDCHDEVLELHKKMHVFVVDMDGTLLLLHTE